VSRTSRRALASAAALVLALTACGGDDDVATPTTSPSPSSTTSPSAEPTAEPTAEPEPTDTMAVAVYYLMDTTNGPRLYREFAARPSTGDVLGDAVQTMLTRAPDDNDYTSLWPADTQVLAARVEGTTAFVDLSGEALEGQGGSAFEAASLQQLVHTVTAAEPSAEQVQLLVDGEPVETLWGAVDTSAPVTRAPQAEVLGPVWLLTPTEGGTLARGAEFGGVATVFEATVNWQWLQDGRVVADGFSTASEGAPGRGEWSSTVDVPPGDYELKAFESSAEDGSETFVDTKTVTVTG
jgi:spore germination protein GerM